MSDTKDTAVLGDFLDAEKRFCRVPVGGAGYLGCTDYSEVWKVADMRHVGEFYAAKLLRPPYDQDSKLHRQLENEVHQALRLDHPNIVRVYPLAYTFAGSPIVLMECLEGRTLRDVLKMRIAQQAGGYSLKDALELLWPIAEALDYAWREWKLIHRDLKPENIYLCNSGVVKLIDLGLAARAFDTRHSVNESPVRGGTFGYMAPEASLTQSVKDLHPSQDVHALSVVLYELLDPRSEVLDSVPTRPPVLSESEWQTLSSGWNTEPEARPQSCLALFQGLTASHAKKGKNVSYLAEADEAFNLSYGMLWPWQQAIIREKFPGAEATCLPRGWLFVLGLLGLSILLMLLGMELFVPAEPWVIKVTGGSQGPGWLIIELCIFSCWVSALGYLCWSLIFAWFRVTRSDGVCFQRYGVWHYTGMARAFTNWQDVASLRIDTKMDRCALLFRTGESVGAIESGLSASAVEVRALIEYFWRAAQLRKHVAADSPRTAWVARASVATAEWWRTDRVPVAPTPKDEKTDFLDKDELGHVRSLLNEPTEIILRGAKFDGEWKQVPLIFIAVYPFIYLLQHFTILRKLLYMPPELFAQFWHWQDFQIWFLVAGVAMAGVSYLIINMLVTIGFFGIRRSLTFRPDGIQLDPGSEGFQSWSDVECINLAKDIGSALYGLPYRYWRLKIEGLKHNDKTDWIVYVEDVHRFRALCALYWAAARVAEP